MSPEFESAISNIFREPIGRKLLFLTLIFMLVCAILLGTDEYLRQKHQDYHEALNNEYTRHNLGKILSKKLLNLESQIFRLSLIEDQRDLELEGTHIEETLSGIQSALKVLRDGGTFTEIVPVNFYDTNEISETFHFSRPANTGYNIEVINLTPKLMDIEQLTAGILEKVKQKLLADDLAKKPIPDRNISLLTKQAASVFLRSHEVVNKIFYDSKIEIKQQEQNWAKETKLFLTLRNYLTFLIIILGLWIFLRTSHQIRLILQQRADSSRHLEHNRQSLETIIENTPVGIAILGADRNIRMVNQSILRLLNIKDPKEVLGKHCFDYLCAQHSTSCPLHDHQEGIYNKEVYLKTSQDHSVPVIKSAIPLQLAGESVILESFLDISERKKTEQALQRETSKMSAMFASMEEGIAFTNRQNRIVEINNYLQKLAEFRFGSLLGRELCTLFPSEKHSQIQQALEGFKDSPQKHPFVFQLDNFFGMDSIIRLQPIYLTDQYDGVVLNVVDVSELTLARREAEKALRSKAVFLANMSHEIRTPLNGVLGMTELLLETGLAPEQKHFAAIIQSSGKTLLTLLNDILDFSKIEAGKMQLEHISFNLGQVVEDAVLLLASRAQEKGLELGLQIQADLHHEVKGDPHRLRQVLTNLVSNAIKFTDQGEVIIRVTRRNFKGQKRLFRFSISDTGIGIDPSRKEHLFENFSQADDSTTRRFGGTGLGLSISKQLVEMMGGTLNLETTPGEGTTFWCEVPLDADPDLFDFNPTIPDFSGFKALVVNNHKSTRFILKKQLAVWGLDTQSAATTTEGMQILNGAAETDPLELVFLDMNFPELKELDTIRAIRSNPKTAATKVIALVPLSSYKADEYAQDIKIDATLPKPVRRQELLDCLTKLLQPVPENETERETLEFPERSFPNRVLVAEDNPVNQQVTLGMLKALGYQADLAANGREAVTILKNNHYDLVLMDCHMPVMDGYAATREIRRTEEQAGKLPVPIIALTADTLGDGLKKTREAGMSGFLSKPFTKAGIQRELARWIK